MHTVPVKIFIPLHFFHVLLFCSLMLNCFELLFFHINLHSTHYNNKAKTELSQLAASSLFGYHMTRFAYQNFAIICHSSPHLFTSQALSGWMGQTHIFSFFQKYLIGFKPRLWLIHSRTFTVLCIHHSCCVNALDWVFIKDISIFCCIGLLFYSDESLSHIACGYYQHTLLLGWYSARDEQSWFPSNMMLRIELHHTR